MKLHQEPEAIQVATLLSVVGAEVRKVFTMFTDWVSDTNQNKIQLVLQKFAAYCQPLKNVPFDISFILECKNRESLTITIRQLFNS